MSCLGRIDYALGAVFILTGMLVSFHETGNFVLLSGLSSQLDKAFRKLSKMLLTSYLWANEGYFLGQNLKNIQYHSYVAGYLWFKTYNWFPPTQERYPSQECFSGYITVGEIFCDICKIFLRTWQVFESHFIRCQEIPTTRIMITKSA